MYIVLMWFGYVKKVFWRGQHLTWVICMIASKKNKIKRNLKIYIKKDLFIIKCTKREHVNTN